MMIRPDEAAFLSEMSELLGDCEAPAAPEAVRHEPTTVTGPEGLLFTSHRLVAETEALLSSCSTPSSKTLQRTETLAERRKIRNANAAKRRLKYCKKIENEREQLRQQEKELAVELVELQAKQSERHVETRSMPVWQAIATRQLQSRVAAEAELRRLRDIVATRTKLLRELGEKVQLHLQGAHQDDRDAGQSGPPLTPEDTVLFERYLREMDEAYNQVGSILNAWGVRGASLASFHPDSKRLHDGNVEYYESLGVQLTPFNSQQTGSALWQAMRLFHRQKCRLQYRGVSDPENMFAVKFRVPDSEKSANLMIRIVLRK
ncbi:hypothetical protein PI125_g26182 [Phytophthora idaei]|nr:hypothetical protein PI125_g26182 [Phytophthora idaei]